MILARKAPNIRPCLGRSVSQSTKPKPPDFHAIHEANLTFLRQAEVDCSSFFRWSKSAYEFTSRFEILHKSKKSGARAGVIHTPHGLIETPGLLDFAPTNSRICSCCYQWCSQIPSFSWSLKSWHSTRFFKYLPFNGAPWSCEFSIIFHLTTEGFNSSCWRNS